MVYALVATKQCDISSSYILHTHAAFSNGNVMVLVAVLKLIYTFLIFSETGVKINRQ